MGIVCALICLAMNQTTVFRNLENWSLDLCFVVRDKLRSSDIKKSDEIVIVALDNQWDKKFQNPKTYISPKLADVIAYVRNEGALAVGVDLFVPDSVHDHLGVQADAVGDAFRISTELARKNIVVNGQDVVLCDVVLPEQFRRPEDDETRPVESENYQFPVRQWFGGTEFLDSLEGIVAFQNLTKPELAKSFNTDTVFAGIALKHEPWNTVGFVNLQNDVDLAVRTQQLVLEMPLETEVPLKTELHYEPSFAMAIVATAEKLDESILKDLKQTNIATIPGKDEFIYINYSGARDCFTRVGFMDVWNTANGIKTTPTVDFKNKIVLIGETYDASPDFKATPFNNQSLASTVLGDPSKLTPGVEVHAHTIQTILDRKYITTPFLLRTPILLIFWGALLGAVLISVGLEKGFLITFLHHWFWKATCIAGFILFSWRIEMVAVLLLAVLIYGVAFAFRWRLIRRMMGLVKSEEVAQALLEDPSQLNLKGEERELTILFSDIRNFTTYSEKHSAMEVVKLLNEYFAIVVPVIEKHGGVVNQYMGDGIMVLFNAPRPEKDHAVNAIRSGIEMVSKVHENQKRWASLGAPDLRIGVGVHTGSCVIGTVGSPDRLDYTAIGDTTNTSARIEAGNKELGTEILVSAASVAQIPPDMTSLLDLIEEGKTLSVKGKETKVVVHEIRLPQDNSP